jgi:hypothetical protein
VTLFIARMSITRASFATDCAGRAVPPSHDGDRQTVRLRKRDRSLHVLAPVQRMMAAGFRSMSLFQTLGASSYAAWAGMMTSPLND